MCVYMYIYIYMYMYTYAHDKFFWHTREQTGHPREKDNVMEKPVADSADSADATISYIWKIILIYVGMTLADHTNLNDFLGAHEKSFKFRVAGIRFEAYTYISIIHISWMFSSGQLHDQ